MVTLVVMLVTMVNKLLEWFRSPGSWIQSQPRPLTLVGSKGCLEASKSATYGFPQMYQAVSQLSSHISTY